MVAIKCSNGDPLFSATLICINSRRRNWWWTSGRIPRGIIRGLIRVSSECTCSLRGRKNVLVAHIPLDAANEQRIEAADNGGAMRNFIFSQFHLIQFSKMLNNFDRCIDHLARCICGRIDKKQRILPGVVVENWGSPCRLFGSDKCTPRSRNSSRVVECNWRNACETCLA